MHMDRRCPSELLPPAGSEKLLGLRQKEELGPRLVGSRPHQMVMLDSRCEGNLSGPGALCLWIVSYLPVEEAVTSLHPILQGGKPTYREEVRCLSKVTQCGAVVCALVCLIPKPKLFLKTKTKTKPFYLYWSIAN